MATHSNILAWRIPWTEARVGLQSIGSHRVRWDWSSLACIARKYLKTLNSVRLLPVRFRISYPGLAQEWSPISWSEKNINEIANSVFELLFKKHWIFTKFFTLCSQMSSRRAYSRHSGQPFWMEVALLVTLDSSINSFRSKVHCDLLVGSVVKKVCLKPRVSSLAAHLDANKVQSL